MKYILCQLHFTKLQSGTSIISDLFCINSIFFLTNFQLLVCSQLFIRLTSIVSSVKLVRCYLSLLLGFAFNSFPKGCDQVHTLVNKMLPDRVSAKMNHFQLAFDSDNKIVSFKYEKMLQANSWQSFYLNLPDQKQ